MDSRPKRNRNTPKRYQTICSNSACAALISVLNTFCTRCSCCICHYYDENRDPSLWLECTPDSPAGSCGLSCHLECAIKQRKVGVFDIRQMKRLDGSYWCSSCGQISEILGCWKKQVTIAKDSRRVGILCYRIDLSFKLLDGTTRFQDLHSIVTEAKNKLETEVGPLGAVSAKLAHRKVSRLSVAADVQSLCIAAIKKADELSNASLDGKAPDLSGLGPTVSPNTTEADGLQSTSHGLDLNIVTVGELNVDVAPVVDSSMEKADPDCGGSENWARHRPSEQLPPRKRLAVREAYGKGPDMSGVGEMVNPKTSEADGPQSMSHGLDLNIVPVPEVNVDVAPVHDSSMDKADVECGPENWAQEGPSKELSAVPLQAIVSTERQAASREAYGNLNDNYEYCVEVFRRLECENHITPEFRRKLLTWFSLRSTEFEREVVDTYIQIFGDDSSALAAQLVDTFDDVI